MSRSFDRLVDGMIDALRAHVLPQTDDEFARGQVFAIIYALNSLKLAADWKVSPLFEQVLLQDAAFEKVRLLAKDLACPELPRPPRVKGEIVDATLLEALRDEGDRLLGEVLAWTEQQRTRLSDPAAAKAIEQIVRRSLSDQLKVESDLTPQSMFHEIATGQERTTI